MKHGIFKLHIYFSSLQVSWMNQTYSQLKIMKLAFAIKVDFPFTIHIYIM